MSSWFNWKGKNSHASGLWVSRLPKTVIPSERVKTVTIPGRAGSLNLQEGEDVYDGYKKEIQVVCINDVVTTELQNWLRGSGDLIVSNDSRFAYEGRVAGVVEFARLGNCLSQATIPFWVQPFKKAVNEEQYQETISATATIVNPGHIASKPKLTLTGTGALEIACGGTQMVFTHRPDGLVVDCDAQIMVATAQAYDSSAYYYRGDYMKIIESGVPVLYRITVGGIGSAAEWERVGVAPTVFEYLWPGEWSGEYLLIPTGSQEITVSGTASIAIEPRWRWL